MVSAFVSCEDKKVIEVATTSITFCTRKYTVQSGVNLFRQLIYDFGSILM